MGSILERLFEHNLWANLRLIDSCAELPPDELELTVPGTFGGIRDTLVHMVLNEENYLSVVAGEPVASPLRGGADFPGVAELRERARRSGERFVRAAARGNEDEILRGEWRGEPFAIPASTFLIQALEHASHHRAQIATILTQLGVEPPAIDGWAFDEACPVER